MADLNIQEDISDSDESSVEQQSAQILPEIGMPDDSPFKFESRIMIPNLVCLKHRLKGQCGI